MYFWTPLQRLPGDVAGIPIFSPAHLLWLFCALGFCAVFVMLFRGHKTALRVIAWSMLLSELLRICLLLCAGCFTAACSMPLHLCGVMIFVELYAVLRRKPLAMELCWSLGLPGALCALATPGEVSYPFWNFYYLQFIFVHTLLFLIPLLLLADFHPNPRRLPQCFLFLLALAAFDWVWNGLSGGNYLFLRSASAGSLLEAVQRQFGPFYLPAAAALVWAVWGIHYACYFACRRLLRRPAFLGRR